MASKKKIEREIRDEFDSSSSDSVVKKVDDIFSTYFGSRKSIFKPDKDNSVNSSLQPSLQRVSPYLVTPIVYYDDIVDKSHFNVHTGQIEDDFNGSSLAEPRYDYKNGFIPKSDPVTPTILALRSGRLNQADISELERAIAEISRASVDSDNVEEAKKAQKAIDDARQEVLDDAIGFDKSTVGNKSSS